MGSPQACEDSSGSGGDHEEAEDRKRERSSLSRPRAPMSLSSERPQGNYLVHWLGRRTVIRVMVFGSLVEPSENSDRVPSLGSPPAFPVRLFSSSQQAASPSAGSARGRGVCWGERPHGPQWARFRQGKMGETLRTASPGPEAASGRGTRGGDRGRAAAQPRGPPPSSGPWVKAKARGAWVQTPSRSALSGSAGLQTAPGPRAQTG